MQQWFPNAIVFSTSQKSIEIRWWAEKKNMHFYDALSKAAQNDDDDYLVCRLGKLFFE